MVLKYLHHAVTTWNICLTGFQKLALRPDLQTKVVFPASKLRDSLTVLRAYSRFEALNPAAKGRENRVVW